MKIKGLIDVDFDNYKLPSMFIIAPTCTFKCERETPYCQCQNRKIAEKPDVEMDDRTIILRYLSNETSEAIVFGGLEPFDNYPEIVNFIKLLRDEFRCDDDVVIYTGYRKDEVEDLLKEIEGYPNIIVKFGRFIPFKKEHYDPVLGVNLSSDNQYGEVIE